MEVKWCWITDTKELDELNIFKSFLKTSLQFERFELKNRPARRDTCRLQNSPYFCVFKYARTVKQKVWSETENRERDA